MRRYEMTVYFIANSKTLDKKIGFTDYNPNDRLKTFQTGNADKLILLKAIKGNLDKEKELKDRFEEYKKDGGKEWFKLNIELLAYMCGTDTYISNKKIDNSYRFMIDVNDFASCVRNTIYSRNNIYILQGKEVFINAEDDLDLIRICDKLQKFYYK